MEDTNQSNSKPRHGVYGKVKKIITFSYPLKQSPSSPPQPNNYLNSYEHPKGSNPIPIDHDQSAFTKIKNKQSIFGSTKDKVGHKNEQGGSGDRFSDYIKRAKMKMRRSMTEAGGGGGGGGRSGGGKGASKLESINKKTSAYIDHAKMKMRTASVVGFGKKPN